MNFETPLGMDFRKFLLISIGLIAVGGNAVAAPEQKREEPLIVHLTLKKVVLDAKGHETLQDATAVKPGDVIEYSAAYFNRSKAAVTNLKASLPVPTTLEYVKQSAKPADVQASVDGKDYAPEPLVKSIKDASGQVVQTEVPYAEYRNLRWEVAELAAGKRFVGSARMRIPEPAKSPLESVLKQTPISSTPVIIK